MWQATGQDTADQQSARASDHHVSSRHLDSQHLLPGGRILLHAQSARLCAVACFVSAPQTVAFSNSLSGLFWDLLLLMQLLNNV